MIGGVTTEIICFIDKTKADDLMMRGFNCVEQTAANGIIYQFVKTPELETYLNGKFSERDFFIGKTLNF